MPKRPTRPDPEPLEFDEVLVVGVGTALWGLAFLVLLALRHTLAKHGSAWWLWVCVAGFTLGLLGLRTVSRRRDRPRHGG